MQFPNLPTDNLYKFIATAGLILILISVVFPLWVIHDLRIKKIEITTEMKIIDADAKSFKREFEIHVQMPHNKPGLPAHSHKPDQEKINEIEQHLIKTGGQFEKVDFIESEIRRMKICIILGNIIGIALTCYGFSLWYSRLQKYQDKIIKNEAQKSLSSFEKHR